MKASQFIYTSWRNSPNAGFSKYSVTPDISQQDCEDIRKMMKYVALPGLPYQPTWEEIQTKFPPNVSFFPLASGKYCLAQSSYVGHEYRGFEDEGRMGNYLLHALVIDDISDFVPMSFVGESVFLRDLTMEQWRATNPPPLEKIEIPSAGAPLSQSEITSFFGSGRADTLKKLVEAIVAAQKTGAVVYFNDEHTNMRYWYKALAMCLPTEYAGKIAFSTYALTAVRPTDISPCCKLRISNVSASLDSSVPVAAPNITEETRKGNFIIDLVRKIQSNITVGEYAETVVNKFMVSAFDALGYAKKIDNTVKLYGCDISRAIDINAFVEGRLDRFPTLDSLLGVIGEVGAKADSRMQVSLISVANKIVAGEYPFNDSLTSAIKTTVYPNLPEDMKQKVIAYVINNVFAATNASSPAEFARAVNAAVPCSTLEAVNYIFSTRMYDSILSRGGFGGYYLATVILENYSSVSAQYGAAGAQIVERVTDALIKEKNTSLLDSLVALSPATMAATFNSMINSAVVKGELYLMPRDVFFYIMSKGGLSSQDSIRIMLSAIRTFGAEPDFRAAYLRYASANVQVDSYLRSTRECEQFFEEMQIDEFMNAKLTANDFCDYYTKIYSVRPSDTAFESKLREHLRALPWEQTIKDALAIYNKCFMNKGFLDERDRRIVGNLCAAVFDKPPKRALINALLKTPNLAPALENFSMAVIRQGIPENYNFAVVKLYTGIVSQPTETLLEKIRTQTLWDAVKNSPDKIAAINRELFDDFIQTVLTAIKNKKTTTLYVAHAILPLSIEEKSFSAAFGKMAQALAADEKQLMQVMSGILLYVATALPADRTVASLFDSYLATTNKKIRASLMKVACKNSAKDTDRIKVVEFINSYNDKHPEGFFAKLKGIFK